MPTYSESESGVETGHPIELYTLELPTATYRMTSYGEDVEFDGETYEAIPIGRGSAEVVAVGQPRELTVTLPRDHEASLALLGSGIPPRTSILTITRTHDLSDSQQLWRGHVSSCSFESEYVRLRVPSAVEDAFKTRLPIAIAQRSCNHMLYDSGCGASPNNGANFVSTAMSAQSGTSITVASMSGKPDGWAQFGYIERTSDGERRSVLEHAGNILTLDVPFGAFVAGQAVRVNRGCAHTITACKDDFDNVLNFGGIPDMPEGGNPTSPTGLGTIQQG